MEKRKFVFSKYLLIKRFEKMSNFEKDRYWDRVFGWTTYCSLYDLCNSAPHKCIMTCKSCRPVDVVIVNDVKKDGSKMHIVDRARIRAKPLEEKCRSAETFRVKNDCTYIMCKGYNCEECNECRAKVPEEYCKDEF